MGIKTIVAFIGTRPERVKNLDPLLTRNERKVLNYYLSVVADETDPFKQSHFRRSHNTIADETGLGIRTVQRINTRLADLDILSWIPGHGSRRGSSGSKNGACTPNEYRIDFDVLYGRKGNNWNGVATTFMETTNVQARGHVDALAR